MRYFTGKPGQFVEDAVLTILQSFLSSHLAAEYSGLFGQRVKFIRDETEAAQRLEKESLIACVFLTFADGSHETLDWPTTVRGLHEIGTRHEMGVRFNIITDVKCMSLEQPLRDAIRTMINNNRKALRELGLFDARATADKAHGGDSATVTPYDMTTTAYTLR